MWHDGSMSSRLHPQPGARLTAPTLFARTARLAAAVVVASMVALPPAAAADSPPRAELAPVELQVSLCAPPDEIVRALDLRPSGDPLEVWLFDDDALSLYARGLRLRLRMAGPRAQLTLKVANQDCAQLKAEHLPRGEGKCEYDLHGDQVAGAVSLETVLDAGRARRLVEGREPAGQALSAAQNRYLREVVRAWPLPPDLRALGPVEVLRYRTADKRYDVDVSRLPGGERYVEIARKVPRADAERAHGALLAAVARAGVALCPDQSAQAETKLRTLLRRR